MIIELQMLAVLSALLLASDARPAGAGHPKSVSLPVLPAGSFGPLMGAGPAAPSGFGDDFSDDPLDAMVMDPMGTMGKLLGGGGGGGGKKLLIIG